MTSNQVEAWVTALKSGRYPKGVSALNADGRYSALGVLADIAGATWHPFTFVVEREHETRTFGLKDEFGLIEMFWLPAEVRRVCGITAEQCSAIAELDYAQDDFEPVIKKIRNWRGL